MEARAGGEESQVFSTGCSPQATWGTVSSSVKWETKAMSLRVLGDYRKLADRQCSTEDQQAVSSLG